MRSANLELKPLGFGRLWTGRLLPFEDWWNEVVLRHKDDRTLNRGQIIRVMRDQDGGAHYDASLSDPVYAAAVRGELTGFYVKEAPDKLIPVPYALETTMRQIGEELSLVIGLIKRGQDVGKYAVIERSDIGEIHFEG
jgi:hypothetical protein